MSHQSQEERSDDEHSLACMKWPAVATRFQMVVVKLYLRVSWQQGSSKGCIPTSLIQILMKAVFESTHSDSSPYSNSTSHGSPRLARLLA